MRTSALIPTALAVILLQACTLTVREDNPYKPTATLQEIMTAIIDPNIDYVWNSVSTVSTTQGTEERRPRTDEEWNAVRQHALTVVEASNLLLIEGRQVARHGANTSAGGAELNPQDIQKGIDAHRADFVKRSHEFHDASLRLIAAIDRKSADELVEAGGAVEHACEQCHSQFWYPNDKKPK